MCLVLANYKDGYFCGEKISPGQFATSITNLSERVGESRRVIRRVLGDLEKFGMIKLENRSNRFSVITICNWETYQGAELQSGKTDGTTTVNPRYTSCPPTDPPTDPQSKKEKKEEKEKKEKSTCASISEKSSSQNFESSMSPDYSELASHWQSLGQVLDRRSVDGLIALVNLGRPTSEVKAAMTAFLKVKRKAQPGEWLSTCTLAGMADGHYADFVPVEKKQAQEQAKLISVKCPECMKSISVYTNAKKAKCICGKIFEFTESDAL